MKVAKIKNNKKQETVLDNQEYSLKKILITLITIIIIFLCFYFITTLVIKPIENKKNEVNVIDSTKILLNHLFDRKEEEYFVLAIKNNKSSINKINYNEIYNNYIKDYKSKENALEFYTVDLNSALNKNFISENTNITDSLNELKIGDEVLFKIKDSKIEEYFIGHSEIIKKLSSL